MLKFNLFKKKKKKKKSIDKQMSTLEHCLEAEALATRQGIEDFKKRKQLFEGTSPLLRRNIHRLEKGLCMPERRPVFAADFILETVTLFVRLSQQPDASVSELKWAHDVLDRYFTVVDPTADVIADARALWNSASEAPHQPACEANTPFAPYKVRELEQFSDFQSFFSLCKARRSQRWFLPVPVPRKKIEAAVMAALQAPSACNRQPFAFHCAFSPEMIGKITDLPLGTKGFGDKLPAVIAVIGDLSMYAEPRDRHLIYVDSALAAMQFMLAITAQGLGSVPMNWPDIPENHQALRELLDLRAYQVPVMLIGVGVPDPESSVPFSAKRPVEEVLRVVE